MRSIMGRARAGCAWLKLAESEYEQKRVLIPIRQRAVMWGTNHSMCCTKTHTM